MAPANEVERRTPRSNHCSKARLDDAGVGRLISPRPVGAASAEELEQDFCRGVNAFDPRDKRSISFES